AVVTRVTPIPAMFTAGTYHTKPQKSNLLNNLFHCHMLAPIHLSFSFSVGISCNSTVSVTVLPRWLPAAQKLTTMIEWVLGNTGYFYVNKLLASICKHLRHMFCFANHDEAFLHAYRLSLVLCPSIGMTDSDYFSNWYLNAKPEDA
ncbi:hypothetical protein M8C21_023322, partial [Ambrosia artemisiifolia]